MKKANELNVKGMTVRVVKIDGEDFVCLTDMAKLKSDDAQQTISNWMRNRMTIEYLGLWEYLYNPSFKPLEFEGFRNEVGLNSFTMSPSKWIEGVNAIGMVVQAGRYGGTYARNDIAFKFASWLSVEFELYLVKEFQRLKVEEQKQLGWSAKRELAKINYRIHTDAIQQHLIPAAVTRAQMNVIYANEADVLNVALFGQTHQHWQAQHPDLSTGKVKSVYRGLVVKRPGRLGSASKPASRRVNTRLSATPNPPVDGSIPVSRPRRRQAGIRSASGGSMLPLRRFPCGPYQRVLRRMMRSVV